MKLRKHGRRLVIRVRVVRGRGALRVAVSRGHRRAHLRHRRSGALHRYAARLPRRGRWTISVRFSGVAGWSDRRLPLRAVRVR